MALYTPREGLVTRDGPSIDRDPTPNVSGDSTYVRVADGENEPDDFVAGKFAGRYTRTETDSQPRRVSASSFLRVRSGVTRLETELDVFRAQVRR